MELYELSRIVMPTSDFVENVELFVNQEEAPCYINGAIKNCNIYKFNTWMNMFAPKKHYFYCELGDIYLKLKVKGRYILQVVGSNSNKAFDRIDEILINQEYDGNQEILIPNSQMYDGIYYTIIEDKNKPIEIINGAWCTNKGPQRENKLAVVTCTFKREKYINKNITLFEQFIKENPNLKDKIKLIVADNGKTLDVTRSNDKVKIIPNMNAGGAGGFTRGLMDVIEQNAGFTRVLFMDDDVEMFPESFYRTLMLANYLKDEYKDSFINGAMLDLYNKSLFFENLAIQNELWVEAYHKEQSLDYDNILNINHIPENVFNNEYRKVDTAWWYHCFDVSAYYNNGLPVPIFFRGDDVEWSWRNYGKHHISMNGICVWHAPFKWRVSKVAEYYYLPRNMFFLNSIYTKDFKQTYQSMLKKRLNYLLHTYDYVSLELFKTALEDILKGSNALRVNPEKQFIEINSINRKTEYINCEDDAELDYAENHRTHAKKWRKFIWKITKNGRYCPKFLFKKRGVALEWYPPVEDFMLVKEVKVYNLFTKKYEIRRFDKKKLNFYKKEIKNLLNEIKQNYDKLHEDHIKAHKEFSTMEFWKKYLEI